MVAETDTKISGWARASAATTVPFPTAVGPETTVSLGPGADPATVTTCVSAGAEENSATNAALWCLPRPRSRRLAAMSSRSITFVARTLPTRGRDFSTSITLAWAITSSCSAAASTSASVHCPRRSACLISARRRRASVAACRAC